MNRSWILLLPGLSSHRFAVSLAGLKFINVQGEHVLEEMSCSKLKWGKSKRREAEALWQLPVWVSLPRTSFEENPGRPTHSRTQREKESEELASRSLLPPTLGSQIPQSRKEFSETNFAMSEPWQPQRGLESVVTTNIPLVSWAPGLHVSLGYGWITPSHNRPPEENLETQKSLNVLTHYPRLE